MYIENNNRKKILINKIAKENLKLFFKSKKELLAFYIFQKYMIKKAQNIEFRYKHYIYAYKLFKDFKFKNLFLNLSEFIIKNKIKNSKMFINLIINSDVEEKYWTSQKFYEDYLKLLIFNESIDDAVSRSLQFVEKYCLKKK